MGEIKEKARQRVIDEYGLSSVGDRQPRSPEWENGFADLDPENPSHIIQNGESLCGCSTKPLAVSELFGVTREILLHPDTTLTTPDQFCQTCLAAFRRDYEFTLTADQLECPQCGSQAKSVTDLRAGVTSCKGCGWGR